MADDELVNPRARSASRARGGEPVEGVPGHVASAGAAGVVFHCPVCDTEVLHEWAAIEAEQAEGRDPVAALETVRLPACSCGAQSWLAIDQVEDADPEGDDAITRRAVHEQVMPRVGYLGLRIAPAEVSARSARPEQRAVRSGNESTLESVVGPLPNPDGSQPAEPDQGWDLVGNGPTSAPGRTPGVP